jgi:hypothetical protein
MHPQSRGATFLYENFIKDFFKAHEDKIDAALSKVSSTLSDTNADASKSKSS